jgi:hypothetical protein
VLLVLLLLLLWIVHNRQQPILSIYPYLPLSLIHQHQRTIPGYRSQRAAHNPHERVTPKQQSLLRPDPNHQREWTIYDNRSRPHPINSFLALQPHHTCHSLLPDWEVGPPELVLRLVSVRAMQADSIPPLVQAVSVEEQGITMAQHQSSRPRLYFC